MAKSAKEKKPRVDALVVLQSPAMEAAAKACPLLEGQAEWAECCTRRFLPVARRVAGDDALAMDALQESWIRILQSVRQYRGGPPACAWVKSIVINCSKDAYMGPQKSEVPLPDEFLDKPDPGRDPELAVQEEQFRRLLREMVAALPDIFRETLEERLLAGHSTAETASRLGISYTNVTTRVQRGCKLLAKKLGLPRSVITEALKDS